jgi:translation initiation factor IF-3
LIKRFNRHQQDNRKFYRLNERISAPMLRVLDAEGKQVDVMPRQAALALAREQGLDLVEIAAKANPPVVKLIDYKKFLYQEEKKKREEKRKAKVSETKEVRLGPFMSDNDLQVMINRCRDFLEDSDKVKLVVKFKGREMARTDFGRTAILKVIQSVSDISKVDRDPKMEGRQMVAVLSPERKKHEKTQSEESSSQTI